MGGSLLFCNTIKIRGIYMIVIPHPQRIAQSDLDAVQSAIVSTPSSGEFKVKKIRMNTDNKTIMVTHSSVAEP
jgi:hypothetical protein